jgi:putative ABC transport system permease protein
MPSASKRHQVSGFSDVDDSTRSAVNQGGGSCAGTTTAPAGVVSYPNYVNVRDSGILAGVAAFSDANVALDDGQQTDLIPAAIVSGNYFTVLGVLPAVGRAFLPDEDRVGDPVRVAVVSHAFWQARLGGDPSAGRP